MTGADRGASLIFRGGPVLAGNQPGPVAQRPQGPVAPGSSGSVPPPDALAVCGHLILAVGRTQDIMHLAGPRTRVIDLKGRFLMPGFVDAHAHLVAHGASRLEVNCKYPRVHSIRDIQARIRERAASTAPGQWVRAWGYDQSRLLEGRHPTRFDLDAACPDKPVLLTRACGHIAVVNSMAFGLAHVLDDTPDPPGGKLDRDERGAPNGVLREGAWAVLAGLMAPSAGEVALNIAAGTQDYLRLGITSVHEAGVNALTLRAYQVHQRGPGPRLRVYAMIDAGDGPFRAAFLASGLATGFGDDWLRIGPFKLMVDGSSSGPTAATRAPYAVDPSDHGILHIGQEEIDERFLEAGRAGFQLTAHAVGDRAIEMVLNGIERALAAAGPGTSGRPASGPPDRHRIEHCAMTDPALRARIKASGIVPVLQPVFLHEFGDGYVRNYGPDRAAGMFAARSFLRLGVPIALSTDCPVTFPDPLPGVYTAVTRQTMDGSIVGPGERLTVAQALQAYTMGGAYASGEESRKGSIEPGKLADLVVLSGHPLAARPEELREMKAVLTVVGGEVVFEA